MQMNKCPPHESRWEHSPTDIDQDMDCTKHSDRLLDDPLTRSLVCHVRLDHLRRAALFVNHALRLVSPLYIDVHQGNLGTVPGEKDGGCSAVANLAFGVGLSLSVQNLNTCNSIAGTGR